MNFIMVHSILTVGFLVTFIALVFWAWSGRRKQVFDYMAHLPLEDDQLMQPAARPDRGV